MTLFEVNTYEYYKGCDPIPADVAEFAGESERDEFRQILVIRHNGKIIRAEVDGGEPEDQLFCRNWRWVSEALCQAYDCGVNDGKKKMVEAFNNWKVGV